MLKMSWERACTVATKLATSSLRGPLLTVTGAALGRIKVLDLDISRVCAVYRVCEASDFTD